MVYHHLFPLKVGKLMLHLMLFHYFPIYCWYHLVIQHGHGKWPIYRRFTY